MDDHRIRIILEGIDKLSGVFKGARSEVDKEIDGMRKSVKGLQKELKGLDFTNDPFGQKTGVYQGQKGQFTTVQKTRQEVEKLNKSIKDLKATQRNSKGQGLFGSFSQGLSEANATGKRLAEQLSTEQKIVKARRRALDDETRAGQLALNNIKEQGKERLRTIYADKKADLERDQLNKKRKVDADIERINVKQKQDLAEVDRIEREAKAEATLSEKLLRTPLTQERARLVRRKPSDENAAAIAEIDVLRAELTKTREEEKEAARAVAARDRIKINSEATTVKSNARAVRDDTFVEQNRTLANEKRQAETDQRKSASLFQRVFQSGQNQKRSDLQSPDAASARKAQQDLRAIANESHKAESALSKFGRTAGLAFGDLKRGAAEGRAGLVDFGSVAQKSESFATRLGQNVGRVVGQFGSLVNLRWFFLSSAIQTVGTVAVQLGAAFISVASSAGLAAVAIGTGIAAAASQALPAVGLLAAAFSRIQTVFKAVQLNTQNKLSGDTGSAGLIAARTATEQLADAQYGLRQAYQAVSEAQYNLKQTGLELTDALTRNKEAVLNLAQTRIDVSRGLVDSYFNERDAALSLRAAELGVIDAKRQLLVMEKEQKNNQADINAAKGAVREAEQRLKAAKAERDQAEVANATAQLAVAQQSLSTISITARTTNTAVKEAKLGVDQAVLARDKAKVDDRRTKEDAEKTRKQGILGNRQFIAAQREVRASIKAIADARHGQLLGQQQLNAAIHAEAIAQRSLKDIEADRKSGAIGGIPGKQQLDAILKQFSPSERDLYNKLLTLRDVYKKAFRPITDVIVEAVSRAVGRITGLLKDPKILSAVKGLATAIGNGIDIISKFAVSPAFRKDLELFIKNAASNLPTVISIFVHLLNIFLRLAKIGSPLFKAFLGFIDRIAGKVDKFTSNSSKSGSFFGLAQKNLKAWEGLAVAILKIFLALGKGSNKSGLGIVQDFTKFLNGIADWLNKHPKKVQKFFEDSRRSLERIAGAADKLGKVLFKAFTSKSATDFVVFVLTVVVPAIVGVSKVIQTATSYLLKLFNVPFIGPLAKGFVEFLIFEKTLNRIFPVTQKLTNLLKLGFKTALENAFKSMVKLGGATKAFATLAKSEGFFGALGAQFPKLAGVVGKLGGGFTKLGVAFAAAGKGIIKVIALVGRALIAFVIANPWVAALIAVIALVVLLDRKFHFIKPTVEAIKRAAEVVFKWIKDNWKLLLVIITAPFTFGLLAIIKWHTKIKDVILDLIGWFRDHWKLLAGILVAIFLFPEGLVFDAIWKWHKQIIALGGKIINGLVGWFKKLPGLIIGAISGLPALILGLFTGLGGKIIHEIVGKIPGLSKALGIAGGAVKAVSGFFGGSQLTGPSAAKIALGSNSPFKGQVTDYLHDVFDKASKGDRKAQALLRSIDPATRKKLRAQGFQTGGTVYADGGYAGGHGDARGTDTVPAMLTPGEWVLNKVQQNKVARALGTAPDALQRYLFGPDTGTQRLGSGQYALTATGTKLNSNYDAFSGPGFQLTPSTDNDGNVVWFAEFGDKTYGQVTVRDANRILASNGSFVPAYLLRSGSKHGGLLPGHLKTAAHKKKSPGPFKIPGVHQRQLFAQGGPVLNPPAGGGRGGNTVTQHFNVQTQGETDWNYAMRLGAIHAQESY